MTRSNILRPCNARVWFSWPVVALVAWALAAGVVDGVFVLILLRHHLPLALLGILMGLAMGSSLVGYRITTHVAPLQWSYILPWAFMITGIARLSWVGLAGWVQFVPVVISAMCSSVVHIGLDVQWTRQHARTEYQRLFARKSQLQAWSRLVGGIVGAWLWFGGSNDPLVASGLLALGLGGLGFVRGLALEGSPSASRDVPGATPTVTHFYRDLRWRLIFVSSMLFIPIATAMAAYWPVILHQDQINLRWIPWFYPAMLLMSGMTSRAVGMRRWPSSHRGFFVVGWTAVALGVLLLTIRSSVIAPIYGVAVAWMFYTAGLGIIGPARHTWVNHLVTDDARSVVLSRLAFWETVAALLTLVGTSPFLHTKMGTWFLPGATIVLLSWLLFLFVATMLPKTTDHQISS